MTNSATSCRRLIVMAFDATMFQQAVRCLETLAQHCRVPHDLAVVAIDLSEEQRGVLRERGAQVFTNYRDLPGFADAPPHAWAMTCRPYLPQRFPGYDVYLWLDADIRIADSDALDFFFSAAETPGGMAICREDDPTYLFVADPATAQRYHALRRDRMLRVFGRDAADQVDGHLAFNAGIFAMHRDCPAWLHYRNNLEQTLKHPYDRMYEQDALTLALLRHPFTNLRVGPARFNWLCSVSQPVLSVQLQRWVRPAPPHEPISLLHLTNSNDRAPAKDRVATWYDWYQHVGLTR